VGGDGGYLISFEGGEGAGKSTQIERLRARLVEAGFDPLVVREPGGTPPGEGVRDILLDPDRGPTSARAELLLYLAARAELTERTIRPALGAGRVVICDRFIDASVAYQGGGRGLDPDRVRELNAFATSGLIPDLTLYLDLDPRIGLERIRGRGALDRLERETIEFHDRVRAAYRELTADPRVLSLDATQGEDEVAEQIETRVLRELTSR
jgi:dTMP kinase